MNSRTYLKRESAHMTLRSSLRYAVLGLAAVVGLAACSDDNKAGPGPGGFYLRIVNSTFQGSGTSQTAPAAPFTAKAIDVLIDSSETNPPSIMNMAPNSVSGFAPNPTSSFQTGPNGHAAGYASADVGVRSYVARLAGLTPLAPSVFTTAGCQQYLPKQYMTAGTFYTLIVAGVHPADTSTVSGKNSPILANCTSGTSSFFPITSIQSVDDPFTPPTFTDASGNKVLQARFHFWNAAPFASTSTSAAATPVPAVGLGSTVDLYVTADSTSPPDGAYLATQQFIASASYRAISGYVNLTAGTYWLTFTTTTTNSVAAPMPILWRQRVTFAPGEVRSFILQNDFSTAPIANQAPNPFLMSPTGVTPYFKVTNILDNLYTL